MGPFAFAAAELLIDAIESVGPERSAVRAALNATTAHDSILGPVTFDAHGQNVDVPIRAFVVENSCWRLWEDSAYATGARVLQQ